MLTDEEYGEATEVRFLNLMNTPTPHAPDWYIRTKRAKPVWDDRGIDFFIYIWPRGGGKRIKVPVQVKSGYRGLLKFKQTQSEIRQKNILLVVVRSSDTDHDIREQVFAALYPIYREGRRFTEFYDAQIREPLPVLAMKRRWHDWVVRAVDEHMARIK